MLSSNGQIELFALYDEIADIENDNDEPIILNTPNKDGESTGVITDAIFISNNSDNKEKALEFIEYALSENVPTRLVWKSRMTFPKSLLSLPLTMIIWKKCSKTGNRLRFPAITKNCRSRH